MTASLPLPDLESHAMPPAQAAATKERIERAIAGLDGAGSSSQASRSADAVSVPSTPEPVNQPFPMEWL